jgi:hypothetical protein
MRKASPKQLPLLDVPEVKPVDLETDADRQERARLRVVERQLDEARHLRWQKHNQGRMNLRECPCAKCKKARRYK